MTPQRFWNLLKAGRLKSPSDFLNAVKEARATATKQTNDTGFARFGMTLDDSFFRNVPDNLRAGKLYFTTEAYLSQQHRADWQNVDIRMQKFAAALVLALRKRGFPFYVHSAFRTPSEQEQLYAKGRSKARFPFAAHCQGKAVDIVHSFHHWGLTRNEWALIGKIGKEVAKRQKLEITWGGDWSFYDPAHWELTLWKMDTILDIPISEPVRKTASRIMTELR
jgi:hypothetical protein